MQFEVDSASGTTTGPTFASQTETVTAGSTATYPVTLPSSVTSATVSCLNLPTGASCSYVQATGAVTITTSSTTPAGIYQITVVFTETVSGAVPALILLPILLLPLARARKSKTVGRIGQMICLGIMLIAVAASVGCAGGVGQTHTVTSSGAVNLTVQ